MGSRSAEKIHFTSFDDLFGGKDPEMIEESQVARIPLEQLHPFKNHPFRVMDDEEMMEMVESVKKYGVLAPAIVRRDGNGEYELISGHRRKRASELAGCPDMPVIIKDLTDDEAVIVMVDSNIQRQNILPSEKAKAYRMKMEALGHQGVKGDQHTAELVGEAAGDSVRTVHRYIRLTYLKPELLEQVDRRRVPVMAAECISFLSEKEQEMLQKVMKENHVSPNKQEAERLKAESEAGLLTFDRVKEILAKTSGVSGITISAKKIQDYFPAGYTKEQIEKIIFGLLDSWKLRGNI